MHMPGESYGWRLLDTHGGTSPSAWAATAAWPAAAGARPVGSSCGGRRGHPGRGRRKLEQDRTVHQTRRKTRQQHRSRRSGAEGAHQFRRQEYSPTRASACWADSSVWQPNSASPAGATPSQRLRAQTRSMEATLQFAAGEGHRHRHRHRPQQRRGCVRVWHALAAASPSPAGGALDSSSVSMCAMTSSFSVAVRFVSSLPGGARCERQGGSACGREKSREERRGGRGGWRREGRGEERGGEGIGQ